MFLRYGNKLNVIPIQKKKGNVNMSNYRPISILPIMSKIIGKVAHFQLLNHLVRYSLLSDCQSGFRPAHSTQDVLLKVIDSWRKAIDSGEYVFLDLAKAFNTVDHSILISKLPYYGIKDQALLWFNSYLSDRYQRVCVDGDFSDWGRITVGMPQGSILGPLLFLLYINDLPKAITYSDINLLCR